jgi:hypothetical protein
LTSTKEGEASTLGLPQFFLQSQSFFAFTPEFFPLIQMYICKKGVVNLMVDIQKKKKSDFVCWLVLIILIVFGIMQHPMIIFGVIAFVGLWYYFKRSPQKSADTDNVAEEKEPDFVAAGEKTDSFYSGISEEPSMDGGVFGQTADKPPPSAQKDVKLEEKELNSHLYE